MSHAPALLLFAGTPEFAVPALEALISAEISAGYRLAAVYTQPDRRAGRGRKLCPSPVKQAALAAGLPVEQPEHLRDTQTQARLRAHGACLMVVTAYGLLLPPEVLAAPTLGCLNIHASLLPRWRGAAPIQRAMLAGDTHTGVELMRMDQGLDTGPVFARRETAIGARETAGELHDRLALLGAELLIATLPDILAQRIAPRPQPDTGACYARKLTTEEALIDWQASALEIDRRIRAFNPWPMARTQLGAECIRLLTATPEPLTTDAAPGSVLATGKTGILVATGAGALRIERLQPAGKRAMTATDFLNARRIDGARFG